MAYDILIKIRTSVDKCQAQKERRNLKKQAASGVVPEPSSTSRQPRKRNRSSLVDAEPASRANKKRRTGEPNAGRNIPAMLSLLPADSPRGSGNRPRPLRSSSAPPSLPGRPVPELRLCFATAVPDPAHEEEAVIMTVTCWGQRCYEVGRGEDHRQYSRGFFGSG